MSYQTMTLVIKHFTQRLFFHRLKRAAKVALIGLFTVSSLHAETKLPPTPFPTAPNQWIWDFATGEDPNLDISTYRDPKDGDILITRYYSELKIEMGTWVLRGGWKQILSPAWETYPDASPAFEKNLLCQGLSIEQRGGGGYNEPLSSVMQIIDKDGETVLHELVIVTLLTKKPERAYPKNEYQQREMTVPLKTDHIFSKALPDCTFLIKTANKVIRFTSQGTTQAQLPSDVLILSKKEFDQIEMGYSDLLTTGKITYQFYLWAFYDQLKHLAKARNILTNSNS